MTPSPLFGKFDSVRITDQTGGHMKARQLVECVGTSVHMLECEDNLETVTVFIPRRNTAKRRIRVSRIGRANKTSSDYRVTIGRPNYADREYLKLCKRAKTHPKQYTLKHRATR